MVVSGCGGEVDTGISHVLMRPSRHSTVAADCAESEVDHEGSPCDEEACRDVEEEVARGRGTAPPSGARAEARPRTRTWRRSQRNGRPGSSRRGLPSPVLDDLHAPERHADDRGYFARVACAAEFADRGIEADYPQASVSHERSDAQLLFRIYYTSLTFYGASRSLSRQVPAFCMFMQAIRL